MALTWKDILTTLLAALVYGLYYAMTKGIPLPIITGYRGGVLALAAIGIAMCALSSAAPASQPSIFMSIAAFFGIASFLFIVYGLIVGSRLGFVLLTVSILLLWVVATLRHLLGW